MSVRRLVMRVRDEHGVTMLVSLLFFLVATMVAAVILAASVTTMRRMSDSREQEQAFLTTSSAARLLRDCLGASGCVIREERVVVTYDEGADPGPSPLPSGADLTVEPRAEGVRGPLEDVVVELVGSVLDDPVGQASVTISVAAPEGEAELGDCTLELVLAPEPDNSDTLFSYGVAGSLSIDEGTQILYLKPGTRLVGTYEQVDNDDEPSPGVHVMTSTRAATVTFEGGVRFASQEGA